MHRFEKRLSLAPRPATGIYGRIAGIDAIKGQWKLANALSPQVTERLRTSVIVTSTGASTRIEGSRLGDADVRMLFRTHRIRRLKTRDEQEVRGYLEVLQMVFDRWADIPFSESVISTLHDRLLRYSEKDIRHKGTYKFGSNRVEARTRDGAPAGMVFDPTPPHLVAREMRELIDWTSMAFENADFPRLMVIANFIFEFLAIHPFQDGNGRLSRILTNLLMLQAGYDFFSFVSHEKIIEDNKADYYLALNRTQRSWKSDTEDPLPWLTFFLDALERQSRQALRILTDEPVEPFLSEGQLKVWEYANSADTFSRKEVIGATGLHPGTVDHTLRKLVDMNRIERFGQGRATRYRLSGENAD